MQCNICKSDTFVPGFNGRMANGLPPMCAKCKTVERHRIVRKLYLPLVPLVKDWHVLQFAPDRSVDPSWFAEYVGSSYGGANSFDMMKTGLPDGRFELIVSNHVLEHVRDDLAAFKEMFRVVGPFGVVHVTVPTPTYRWATEDWGFADAKVNEHYRDYGADFPQRVIKSIPGVACAAVAGFDPVTLSADIVYFFSKSEERLAKMGAIWGRHALPITRLF